MSAPQAPIFELRAPTLTDSLGAAEPDAALSVLGLWAAPPAAPDAISFGLPAAAAPAEPVWRVNLPADPQQAHACLAGGVQRIQAARQALPQIEQRVVALAAGEHAARQPGGLSFGLTAAAPLATPERELLAELAYVSGRADPEEVSFGLPGIALPDRAQVQQGMVQVRDFLG
jgi:hypothetical protein